MMPQVDLETLNDTKMVSETLVKEDLPKNEEIPDAGEDSVDVPPEPDYPPESFWLSKDAEYDWFDRNAVYEHKESIRGNSNSTNLNPSINPNSNSSSQRIPVHVKSRASIIGLPQTQKTTFVDSKRRYCKQTNIRLFPKRSESVGKTADSVVEPSSPKVSCMGRVRSKRGRRRSNSLKKYEKSAEKTRINGEKQKTGFYSKLMCVILCRKDHNKPIRSRSRRVVVEETVAAVEPQRKCVSVKLREIPVSDEPVAEPPGLGGVKRFASGRRSGSWTAEDLNQAILKSLELDRRVAPMGGS
ncbi:Hypothetical predicted protein [Olea europaea subsp. europaea]|uniref:Uncharacterized protein n=1 Tax=Olea europaea subsp. europaea TaxID=158383 RepID=A0A8S0U1U8_OLEEU|nr:Hypothetical predicted protein [Olea europaea subsp. europaea]